VSSTRLYLDANIEPGSELELTGDRARYIGRVLRLRKGDRLNLFDGRGREYGADIVRTGKSSVVVQVIDAIGRDVESPLDIHLLQGVSRGERMDVVVQKATELGIHRITPVQTEYTVVRLSGDRAEKRLAHWRGVAASACEQCGRNQLPGIDPITGLREWLGQNFGDERRRIVLAPGAGQTIGSLEPPDGQLTVLIGPEGGLSDDELELATSAGFEAIGFGPRVLRTETAAVAVLSALQVAFGDCG
jgi:16S rRNA (uracil1498-N3)-methyltransferase